MSFKNELTKFQNTIGLGSSSSLREIRIDEDTVNHCKFFQSTNPWAKMSVRELLNGVFQEGLVVYIDDVPFKADPTLTRLLRTEFKAFGEAAFNEITTRGVVPFRILLDSDSNMVPRIVTGKGYYMTVDRDYSTERLIYKMYRTINRKTGEFIPGKHDKKVIIKGGFNADPLETGKLTSIVCSLLEDAVFTSRLRACKLKVSEKTSDLPILLQSTQSNGLNGESAGFDIISPNDTLRKRVEDQYQLTSMEERFLRTQTQALYDYYENERNGNTERRTKYAEIYDSLVALPNNKTVATQPMPTTDKDALEYYRLLQETITSAYGISRSIIVSDLTNRTAANAELIQKSLKRSIDYWKILLGDFLSYVFNAILDAATDGDADGVNDVYKQIPRGGTIALGFPIASDGVTKDSLLTDYAMGVIDYPEYWEHSRKLAGLSTHTEGKRDLKDPYGKDQKTSVLRSNNPNAFKVLGGIGDAKFQTEEDKEKEREKIEKKREKKKKKKEKEESEQKKKKQKKESE